LFLLLPLPFLSLPHHQPTLSSEKREEGRKGGREGGKELL